MTRVKQSITGHLVCTAPHLHNHSFAATSKRSFEWFYIYHSNERSKSAPVAGSQDRERGVVWEETIIFLEDDVKMVRHSVSAPCVFMRMLD